MDSQVKREQGVRMTKSRAAVSYWVTLKQHNIHTRVPCTQTHRPTHIHAPTWTRAYSTTGAGRGSTHYGKLAHTFSNPLPPSHSPCLPTSLSLHRNSKNITEAGKVPCVHLSHTLPAYMSFSYILYYLHLSQLLFLIKLNYILED